MIKKEFQHNKKEPCKLCNKNIDTSKEKYAIILDLLKEDIFSIGFYHSSCLRDHITNRARRKVEEQIDSIKQWGENLISNITGNKKEYVIEN